MVTSLTGSLMLLTDKPETYSTDMIEPAKRTAPVLFTVPGQIYDVDPSRSSQLHRVETEVSGSGPRIFDAGLTPLCHLYSLEINRPFENWLILGRTGGDYDKIFLKDLGLKTHREYWIFEFWSKKLLGSFSEDFYPGPIDPEFNCQVFCIRERKDHPWIIGTSRHITCGGVELVNLEWNQNVLSVKSMLIENDQYDLFICVPEGFTYKHLTCNKAKLITVEQKGVLLIIQLVSELSGLVQSHVEFDSLE